MVKILFDSTQVPDDTVTKMIDGEHYLLTKDEQDAYDQAVIDSTAKEIAEAPIKYKADVIKKPITQGGFGSAEQQLDYIAENGMQAWLDLRASILKTIEAEIKEKF